jgi:hypothetical protein
MIVLLLTELLNCMSSTVPLIKTPVIGQ